jgi:hypothetical protein
MKTESMGEAPRRPRRRAGTSLALVFAIGCALGVGSAFADDDDDDDDRAARRRPRPPCSATTQALYAACKAEVTDDGFVNKAICINIESREEREACFDELETTRAEDGQLCKEQRDARQDVCEALGEDRYDPDFDPALFDDPKNPTSPNPYFPLAVGNSWEFRGGGEVVTIQVLDEIKAIEGVGCIVVRDVVTVDGQLVEDTDDWFAQAKDGGVHYCGEEVKDFETFDGDMPKLPELVSIDGSFKAGRDGAKPGTQFLANPMVGALYRQEFAVGNAEDLALVLSTTYGFGSDADLDRFVPQALADLLCADDCVVTHEFTPIEPDAVGRKYYAPGIGLFLEVNPESGETVQLVSCNVDTRCAALPQP